MCIPDRRNQELTTLVMWPATSCQALRDAAENHRQALATARARAQALMTVLHEAEASFSAVEAAFAQVQQALNDTLACTESAGLQVNEQEPGTKRPREEVATSQHAAGASSEANPEAAPEPPSLTPSAPLPLVASSTPPRSEPSAPPPPSASLSAGAGMEANSSVSSEALPAHMDTSGSARAWLGTLVREVNTAAAGETVIGTQTMPVAHTMASEVAEEQNVGGVPAATADAVVGVQHRYTTRAKLVSGVTVSSRAEDALPRKMPRTASPRRMPHNASPLCDFESMDAENTRVLAQDEPRTWHKGVRRFRINGQSAADMLSWVVDNTSRTLSTITTGTLWLDGFHNWDAVHSGGLDASRQQQHTFVISRAQRRHALKIIPGLNSIVAAVQAEIESMHLHGTPQRLEWLTGHILNQGDVNARFTYHQDTTEERNAVGGRRDRHVLYTAIIKLNRGGCTSMRVCGQPEVFYLAPGGSGVIFRSDLHHRTEKAEPGIWKIALFFGVFL